MAIGCGFRREQRARIAISLVLTFVAAIAIAACGTKTLNTDEVESSISDGLAKQSGVKPKSVACPDDVKAEKGDTFTCTATAPAGDTAKVLVTQLNDDGQIRYVVPPGQFK